MQHHPEPISYYLQLGVYLVPDLNWALLYLPQKCKIAMHPCESLRCFGLPWHTILRTTGSGLCGGTTWGWDWP